MTWAMVFPGQGSQSQGMLTAYAGLPEVRATFAEASEILGQDLWQLVQEGPEEQLNATVNTQPVMLAAGVGLYRAWCERRSQRPDWLAGHSLGEYTALVAAGSLSFDAALQLTRYRATIMQEAVPVGSGAMAAILGLADEAVVAACEDAAQGDVVEAVNFNSPGQVVIAGQRQAVERAIDSARARGAKRAVLLPLSVPSHCRLMKPAAQKLEAYLDSIDFLPPKIPVIHNAAVEQAQDVYAIRHALVTQLYRPVRWVETIRKLAQLGCVEVVECGPGKVLTPLVRRIEGTLTGISLADTEALDSVAFSHP